MKTAKLNAHQIAAAKAWKTMNGAAWQKAHGGAKKVASARTLAAKKAWVTMRKNAKAAKRSSK